MQLIMVTAVKESAEVIDRIFKSCGIEAYSTTDIVGFRKHPEQHLTNEWFGAGDPAFESVLFFSFTAPASAEKALQQIREWNNTNTAGFPIRAFLLPVTQSI
jgi:hypothetical protein